VKIVHLIFSFQTGGAETMLVDIANEQVNHAEVSIVIINAISNQTLLSTIDNRIYVRFINRKEGSRNLLPIIRLNRLLLRMKSDVLHCHNHNIIPLLLPSLKKKSVLTVHDVNINTKYFKHYKKLFAISQVVKEDILKRSGIHATLVYNGICTEKVLKKEKKIKGIDFKIVIVSRLHHEKKGQHLAIEALMLLKERGITNIHLDFIGSGSSEHYLKDFTAKFELNDNVKFLGLKDRNYIYTHLKDYDLLVQPSLYEGFGLTVAEAMAAKVPVLVSDIDGPMEIIENGKYGYFFKKNDSENLSLSLKALLESYNLNETSQKIEQAYLHICDNFSVKKTSQQYLEQYFNIAPESISLSKNQLAI
jgi:glycosyltransferase involved in cell wall biosynthesis